MDRNIRAFLAVIRQGSLTAASDAIGLTQPALTKSIRRLETDIGARLFKRSPKGMELTQVGELFLARAQAIEMNWSQAREEARGRAGGGIAEFRIASGAAYHMRITPLLVRRLVAEFPETRFVLDFDVAGASLPLLESGEIHLFLGAFIHEPGHGIVTEKLLDVVTRVMCCRSHPLARRKHVLPSDLTDYSWVIYKRDACMREELSRYCMVYQLPRPTVAMEVDALASAFMIVNGTRFLTAVPMTLRRNAEEAGLVTLPLDAPIWTLPSGAWMRKSTCEFPILRRALEILRELAGTGSG